MAQGSNSNIMSVGEMIDNAFGEPDVNNVNHKLIQTILYLLARQLRILERRVEVEIGAALPQTSSSTLSVTEVKVHVMQKKKTKPVKKMNVSAATSSTGKASTAPQGIDGGAFEGVGQPGSFGKGMAGERGLASGKGGVGRVGITTSKGAIGTGGGGTGPGGGGIGPGEGETGPGGGVAGGTGGGKGGTDRGGEGGKGGTDRGGGGGKGGTDRGGGGGKGGTDRGGGGGKGGTDRGGGVGKESGKGIAGTKWELSSTTGESSSDKPDRTGQIKYDQTKSTTDKSLSDKTTTESSSSYRTSTDKTSSEKPTTDKTSTTSMDKTFTMDKSSTDKTSTDVTSTAITSSDKTSSDKTSTDKSSTAITSSDKTKSTTDKTSSDRTSSDKTSTDKTSTAITSSHITSSDKTSTVISSSDKTSTDKTSTAISSSDKTATDRTSTAISSSDKTSTDKTSTDKTSTAISSSDKTSTDKTSTAISSSDKTSTDKTSTAISSSDKTSTDKTSTAISSSNKTSTDKTSSDKTSTAITSSDKTSSDKTTTDKTSSDTSTTEKTSSKDKSSSSDKRSTTTGSKSTTDKTSSSKKTTSSSRKSPDAISKLLDEVELQREAELRVIHQLTSCDLRADSREEYEKTPSPMASLDSVEAAYEKLLVVERIPIEEAKAIAARGRSGIREKAPRLSVVTLEQFERLAAVVRELQEKFKPVGSAVFPENIQLMHELRKGASLTDAMAALQLSARLEAAEKALDQMTSLVTDLASKTPGVNLNEATTSLPQEQDMKVLFGGAAGVGGKDKTSPESKSLKSSMSRKQQSPTESLSLESVMISLPASKTQLNAGTAETDKTEGLKDKITYEELDGAMRELYDDIMKKVSTTTAKTSTTASDALKIANRLETKLNASLNLGTRMQDLEDIVSKFAEQINILDTGLSSQMTNYQEELTQMQHDLETALETMAELLANTGGDANAVAELNASLSNLQSDIEDTMLRQTELRNTQTAYYLDLESLRRQIEILRDTKSDREEVADALRDKAGLGALNGLVSILQFDAVRGDIEKRIAAAYDKFNSQEILWQKAIDELIRELNEKADIIQLTGLKDNINKHLETLAARMRAIKEIVGEPRAAAVAKKLYRDANCLSCATPADMVLEEHGAIPALPAMRSLTTGTEAPKEDGDHAPCYPGRPILHPIDPRAHICQRWCGGSHTVVSHGLSRIPPGMIIADVNREPTTILGTDGKTYKVDEPRKPCEQCKIISHEPNLVPEGMNNCSCPDCKCPTEEQKDN